MPDPVKFLNEYDSVSLYNPGNPYLSDITGLSLAQVSEINTGIAIHVGNVNTKFPELNSLSAENIKITVKDASALSGGRGEVQARNAETCVQKCKREGMANIAAATFLGGATGAAGGLFGAWAGATLGFWAASSMTISCLNACSPAN